MSSSAVLTARENPKSYGGLLRRDLIYEVSLKTRLRRGPGFRIYPRLAG